MNLQNIKNIIFDLGGVIIDVDPPRSFQALQAFSMNQKSGDIVLSENVKLFLDYEKGLISSRKFREGVRTLTENTNLEDKQIDDAWNLMLLDVPLERIEILKKLKDRFQLFVLSNTNDIHVPAFNSMIEKVCGEPNIDCFFDRVYFSHEVQMRKPEPEIYRHVLEENNLNPEETLFIDDRYENIEAARGLGIQTYHVDNEGGIAAFFNHI